MTAISTSAKYLYLSRLIVTGEAAHNPYELHRRLWLCFPGRPDDERSFLFHTVWSRDPVEVVLQSAVQPVSPRYEDVLLHEVRPFRLDLREDVLHRFVLTANVTKKSAANGNRIPIKGREEQLEWLARKLRPGAELVEAGIHETRSLQFKKRRQSGKVEATTFSGVLSVRDSEALDGMLQNGIGPAKSFGCGLILLK